MTLIGIIGLIAIVAIVAFAIGYIGGTMMAHASYDPFELIVDKSSDLPDPEINKVFKDQLEVMLIKENLVSTTRDQNTVTKQFIFYIKTTDNESD